MAMPSTDSNRHLDLFTYTTRLLPRIAHAVILARPDLRLSLVNDMLDEYLARILRLELADPARVPEFACNAEVLAAAHEGVRAAAFCCGWDAVGREVVLFAAGDGYQAGKHGQLCIQM